MDPFIVPGLTLVATKIGLAMVKGEQGGFSLGAGADSLLDIIADISKDTIWARAEKRLLQRLRSPGEALHNHHLTTAVGKTIELVVLKATEEPVLADFKSELKKVAAGASGLWTTLIAAKKPEVGPLTDARLIELFAVPASSRGALTALDVPTWETFLRASGSTKDSLIRLPAEVVTNVADRLHRTLPQALVEVLKDDAEHGGAAFAGLQLLIFGELLAVCLDMRTNQQAQQELIKTATADAGTQHTELIEKLDRLAKQVAMQGEEVFARLPETSRREFRDEGIRQDQALRQLWQLKSEIHLPFRPVEDRENFGDEKIPDSFRPSRSEYREGLVHRPTLADGVEQSLKGGGFALVRGEGACGKTVLALTIALGEQFRDHAAYYLDLTDRDEEDAEAIERLRILAADRVLFIVDNVHLNERLGLDLFEAWKANPRGSRLLMLGRHVEKGPDVEGRQPLLGGVDPAEVFSLEVEVSDLVGTFNRLARRTSTNVVVPTAPAEMQAAWLKLFQGSLVFFSAAVKSKLADLMRGDWALSPEDARVYVRRKYLEAKEVSEQETGCLLRVAVFARLELSASEEMLGWPHLDHSLKHGLIYRSVHDGQFTTYRLSHPGLGDLLLSAANHLLDERQVCIEAARRSPIAGSYLAGRLVSLGQTEAAREVLRAAAQQSYALESLTKLGLQHLHGFCLCAERLGILSEAQQLGRWDEQAALLAAQAKHTQLDHLANFLRYAWQTAELKVMFAEVVKGLRAEKLAAQAEHTPLSRLAIFLRYARQTPELKVMFAEVVKRLDVGKLALQARREPLEHLTSFLTYANNTSELKALFAAVMARLGQPDAIAALARNACTAPLPHLVNFLRGTSLGPAVVQAIDRASWDAARRAARHEQPTYVHALFRVLNNLGRPELAEGPALALIESPKPALWHTSGIGLHQVTQTLRLGRAAGRETPWEFMESVVTPEWLRSQFSRANAGSIAAALFAIRSLREPAVLKHFLRELPPGFLSQALARFYEADAVEASHTLSLLGVADLVRLPINATGVRWPPGVRLEMPDTLANISVPTVLVWLGLRVMARYRHDAIRVPPKVGNRVLQLWRQSKHKTEQGAALSRWMIAWLERCASAGWVLLPDNSRLPSESPVTG